MSSTLPTSAEALLQNHARSALKTHAKPLTNVDCFIDRDQSRSILQKNIQTPVVADETNIHGSPQALKTLLPWTQASEAPLLDLNVIADKCYPDLFVSRAIDNISNETCMHMSWFAILPSGMQNTSPNDVFPHMWNTRGAFHVVPRSNAHVATCVPYGPWLIPRWFNTAVSLLVVSPSFVCWSGPTCQWQLPGLWHDVPMPKVE